MSAPATCCCFHPSSSPQCHTVVVAVQQQFRLLPPPPAAKEQNSFAEVEGALLITGWGGTQLSRSIVQPGSKGCATSSSPPSSKSVRYTAHDSLSSEIAMLISLLVMATASGAQDGPTTVTAEEVGAEASSSFTSRIWGLMVAFSQVNDLSSMKKHHFVVFKRKFFVPAQVPSYHLILEAFLVCWVVWLLIRRRSYKNRDLKAVKLTR